MSQPEQRLADYLLGSLRWDAVTALMQAAPKPLLSPAGGTAWRSMALPRKPSYAPEPLPVLDDIPEPLRVWKRAGITLAGDGQARFFGIGIGDPVLAYGQDAAAVCYRQEFGYSYPYPVPSDMEMAGTRWLPDHEAPHDHCSCGFYANQDYLRPRGNNSWWEMEAELLGRYVTHEDGWRFGRQRVLAIRVPSRCTLCLGNTEPPDIAYVTREGRPPSGDAAPLNAVRPVHAWCATTMRGALRPPPDLPWYLEFDQLRGRLQGVELLPPLPPGPAG
jgi:hypothetical protein